MGAHYYSFALTVWRYEGRRPKAAEFLDQLIVDPGDAVKKRKTLVDLLLIEQSEFTDAEEPSEVFAEELASRLTIAAEWLNKQPVTLFKALRRTGFNTNVLITGWIDCDQMDLDLPAVFLKACGRLGLKISIITND